MSELREALGAALDAEQPAPESAPAVELTSTPESTPNLEPEPVPVTSGTVRDSLGRFVKAAEKVTGEPAPEPAPEPAALAEPVAAAPAEPVVAPEVKPPQSWTPAAREVWANVPPAAQQEILRREGEIQRGLQEASSARNIANQLSELVTPYLPRMRMQGATPMVALSNLLQTETILGTGTQQQRAETVAKLVKAYDIDTDTVAIALCDKPAKNCGVPIASDATLAVSETLTNGAFDAANITGGLDPYIPMVLKIIPSAAEVTEGKIVRVFPFTPIVDQVLVRTTATMAELAWDGAATVTGNLLVLDNAGAVDWSASTTITVFVRPS